MELMITGRHYEVSKELKNYIRKRFGKWSTWLAPEAEVTVILAVEKYRNIAEVIASDKRYSLTGKQTSKDMFSAIDLLSEKMGQQLARQHEKLTSGKGETATPRRASAERPPREVSAGRITQVQEPDGKPMTREEAALEFKGSRQPFFVFEDVETGQLAVLTRRKDGNFTLIVKE